MYKKNWEEGSLQITPLFANISPSTFLEEGDVICVGHRWDLFELVSVHVLKCVMDGNVT